MVSNIIDLVALILKKIFGKKGVQDETSKDESSEVEKDLP